MRVLFLLLKAYQPGLFDEQVTVSGHATKKGTYVQPYQAKRKKRLKDVVEGDMFDEAPQWDFASIKDWIEEERAKKPERTTKRDIELAKKKEEIKRLAEIKHPTPKKLPAEHLDDIFKKQNKPDAGVPAFVILSKDGVALDFAFGHNLQNYAEHMRDTRSNQEIYETATVRRFSKKEWEQYRALQIAGKAPALAESTGKKPEAETPGDMFAEPEPTKKEPWQMTLAAYKRSLGYKGEKLGQGGMAYSGNWSHQKNSRATKFHRKLVESAISEGKPVPADVLADYPDLKPAEAAPEPPAAKEPWQMTLAEFRKHHPATQRFTKYDSDHAGLRSKKQGFRRQTDFGNTWFHHPMGENTAHDTNGKATKHAHKTVIKKAIAEGKAVPADVLADYPDLKPKEPEKKPEAAKGEATPTPTQPEKAAKPHRFNLDEPPGMQTIITHAWNTTIGSQQGAIRPLSQMTDKEIAYGWAYSHAADAIGKHSIEPKGYKHGAHRHIIPQIRDPDNLAAIDAEMARRGLNDKYELDIGAYWKHDAPTTAPPEKAAKGAGKLDPGIDEHALKRLEKEAADAKASVESERAALERLHASDNIPGVFQAGGSNYTMGKKREAMNSRLSTQFNKLQDAEQRLKNAESRLSGYRSGEYHENGQAKANSPKREAVKAATKTYADFIRATVKAGDRVTFLPNPSPGGDTIKKLNQKTVSLSGGSSWDYLDIHPWIDGKPATQKEVMAAFKRWRENAESETTTKSFPMLRLFAKAATITEPADDMIAEHARLVKVLRSPSHADDLKEADEQEKELKEYRKKRKKLNKALLVAPLAALLKARAHG